MKRSEIVSIINEVLESTWTDYECIHGKTVEVEPSWNTHMKSLVTKYREAGWTVERKVEIVSNYPGCHRLYAVFVNPSFNKAGRERFEAKYGR